MSQQISDQQPSQFTSLNPALMRKVFRIFMVLVGVSVAISLSGKWYGHSIAMGGHTDSAALREIIIGNNVIIAPENMIRFDDARRDGVTGRLDLYLRWPDLNGYTSGASSDFNHRDNSRNILFLSFEEQSMSRDMSGRFEPIYSALIRKPGKTGPAGLSLYEFDPKSGYLNEMLAVAQRAGDDPFVARCLTGPTSQESLAPCERDIQIGDDLSVSYRFPAELLEDWPALEAAIRAKAISMLKVVRS
jgi:hypothetical protein